MSDVSLLRFLNSSSPGLQSEVLALVHDLELEELCSLRSFASLGVLYRCRQSLGSFAADRALQARRYRPISRPHYKPDLSAFEPFFYQLELFRYD